jgi:glutamate-1-semialdehyde 2,1-aminomutase
MQIYQTAKSKELFDRATKSIAGGVGSAARSTIAGYTPYPIFMEYGEGSKIYDVDGNEYIDYLLALGPLIFGHRPKKIIEAVKNELDAHGSMLGTPHQLEYEVAEMMVEAVPSLELVRFGNSGTEVVMSAIRLARAFTGKEKIVRFEGQYHGMSDIVHFSTAPPLTAAGLENAPRSVPASPGIPKCLADTVIVQPWNNPEILEKTIKNHKHEIAAIITEPIMSNCGCILPKDGYLNFLRDLTAKNDMLLIFDEVITGFRVSYGGAQQYYNVSPDLTTFAKALGGGFPVAALGGKRDIMNLIASGKVNQAGTYNSNPLAMAATKATLSELKNNKSLYEHLFKIGDKVSSGIATVLNDAGVPAIARGVGPMFQVWFSEHEITNYRESAEFSNPKHYHAFFKAMLKRGVLFHPSQSENFFVSTAHTDKDVELTLQIAEDAVKEAKKNF